MPTKSARGGLSYLYDTKRWQNLRAHQLQTHPLCAMCTEQGRTTPATIADHIEPHRNDINKFWLGKLQSLCRDCHNNSKQFQEHRGFQKDIDADGFPTDRNHPFYARERRE
jgi:5-methylcytosine-specific restriction enzyme A